MEYLFLYYFLSINWIWGVSDGQQFRNLPENAATNGKKTNHAPSDHGDFAHGTTPFAAITTVPVSPASSDSTKPLLDTPSAPHDLNPMTYQEYYGSLPYYDIVDYYYIEDDGYTNNSTTTEAITAAVTNDSQVTKQPLKVIPQNNAKGSHNDPMPFLNTGNKPETESTSCDVMTHFGCDIARFERCDSTTQNCRCIGGHLKASLPNSPDACIAAKFFLGDINIPMPNSKVSSLSPQALRIVRDALRDYIKYSMKTYNTDDILLSLAMRTSGDRNAENPFLLQLTYEVALQRDASPTVSGLLRTVLQRELEKVPTADGPPEIFLKIVGQMTTFQNSTYHLTDVFSPLIEMSPCSSPEYTYCAPDAVCHVENGSQVCQCLPGFQDVSPDPVRFPGEVCEEQCHCENQGICVTDPDDIRVKECSCIKWFFGERCHVNGKELLITSISCVVGIAIVVTIVCCCCHARVRHRNRHNESSLFRFTPDTSILKLPRVWMEAHYPDTDTISKDLSPHSIRRMSIATDCNPYFDGYILEDVAASYLQFQSDRSTDTQYTPHPEATLGGAATISSHSIFRHY